MTRGDGRLNHDIDPAERGPADQCGVFGVWAPGEEVAKLAFFGLYALQHRGQESAGIAVFEDGKVFTTRREGSGAVQRVTRRPSASSIRITLLSPTR